MRMIVLLSVLLGLLTASAGMAEPGAAGPPRLAPRGDLTAEERAIGAQKNFEGIVGVPPIYAILLHNPDLARIQVPMASQFMLDGKLDPRDRELAILRNTALTKCAFFFGEHVAVAKKFGLGSADIAAAAEGSSDPRWNAHERAVLKAVEELHRDSMISDATWAELARGMDAAQLVELPLMVGQYKALCYFTNALRVPLRPGNPGLAGR